MSFKRFDRHAEMSDATRGYILDLIRVSKMESFDVENMLYGLFDGYLYDSLLPTAKENMDQESYAKLQDIVCTINTYKTLN